MTALGDSDIELEPMAYRTDNTGEARFPVRWNLRLPDEAINLQFGIDGEVGINNAGITTLNGVLRIEPGSTPLAGTGFAQLNGFRI